MSRIPRLFARFVGEDPFQHQLQEAETEHDPTVAGIHARTLGQARQMYPDIDHAKLSRIIEVIEDEAHSCFNGGRS